MSGGNRGFFIVATLGAIIASGVFASAESRCQGEQNQYQASRAVQTGHGEESQFAYGRSWLPCLVERATANPPSQDGTDKEQRDLVAQEASALWGFWIALFAAFQLVATVIGLVFIKRTLDATWKAVDEAGDATKAAQHAVEETSRIGEAQSRAYLSVIRADLHIGKRRPGPTSPSTDVYLHFHNSGETPAVKVSYHCEAGVAMWRETDVLPSLETVPYQQFITNIPPGEGSHIKVTCYGVLRDWREVQRLWTLQTSETPIGDAPILLIYGVVFYEDVFGHTFRSQFGFYLDEQPMPGRTPAGRDDLPTLQARIPTFERIRDRDDHIRPPPDDEE